MSELQRDNAIKGVCFLFVILIMKYASPRDEFTDAAMKCAKAVLVALALAHGTALILGKGGAK